ncbi:MAG: division/cell wall cluster transcriptional repressor MraZ [Myxococcota bacterium]
MFWGCHEHVLDEKGRTSLPKEFRDLLTRGSESPWLTAGQHCLSIFPAETFKRLRERLASEVLNDAAEALERLIVGNATPCSVDRQGRILIPPPLRRRARLEREIVFTGLNDRVEIWDRARYEAAIANTQENYAQHSRLLRGATR